jgi:prevent-host-death family protein
MAKDRIKLVMLLVIIVVMIKANINQVKENLSKYLAMVEEGETVTICKRNEPVAELTPIKKKRVIKKPFGYYAGQIVEMPGCWDPMTPEEIALWEEGPIEPAS